MDYLSTHISGWSEDCPTTQRRPHTHYHENHKPEPQPSNYHRQLHFLGPQVQVALAAPLMVWIFSVPLFGKVTKVITLFPLIWSCRGGLTTAIISGDASSLRRSVFFVFFVANVANQLVLAIFTSIVVANFFHDTHRRYFINQRPFTRYNRFPSLRISQEIAANERIDRLGITPHKSNNKKSFVSLDSPF